MYLFHGFVWSRSDHGGTLLLRSPSWFFLAADVLHQPCKKITVVLAVTALLIMAALLRCSPAEKYRQQYQCKEFVLSESFFTTQERLFLAISPLGVNHQDSFVLFLLSYWIAFEFLQKEKPACLYSQLVALLNRFSVFFHCFCFILSLFILSVRGKNKANQKKVKVEKKTSRVQPKLVCWDCSMQWDG